MLLYRFPKNEIVKKSGVFCKVDSFDSEGFILSNFLGNEKYQFKESDSSSIKIPTKEIHAISKESYQIQAKKLITAIQNLGIQKTVLSRIHSEKFDTSKAIELFYLLEKEYPNAFVYFFSDEALGTWLGASPEILFQKHQNSGFTVSLAATKKINDLNEWNQKEKLEQAFVTDFIHEQLESIGVSELEKLGPFVHEAGPVKHLKTDFSFYINSLSTTQIINALHPTPAVSGLPQSISLELIATLEQHNRELYAGYIGFNSKIYSSVYVNLRCCQFTKDKIHLYLGGGFTKDSDSELEWLETENKSRTILDLVQKL